MAPPDLDATIDESTPTSAPAVAVERVARAVPARWAWAATLAKGIGAGGIFGALVFAGKALIAHGDATAEGRARDAAVRQTAAAVVELRAAAGKCATADALTGVASDLRDLERTVDRDHSLLTFIADRLGIALPPARNP